MSVTLASLRERYPEIEATPDAVVTRAIGEATRRTHASVFGERRDDAIALRAMHLLAVSPQGINARIADLREVEAAIRTLCACHDQ